MGPTLRGALVPHWRWGSSRLPGPPPLAWPLFPVLPPLLRCALPYSEPPLPFYLKSQWFLSSTAGWQRSSERTGKGLIYGKPGHPGTKDLLARRVLSEEPGVQWTCLVFFQRKEKERELTDRPPGAWPSHHFILTGMP